MTHVTCRLTAKDRDQLRNPTLGNRVWATFTFFRYRYKAGREEERRGGREFVLCRRNKKDNSAPMAVRHCMQSGVVGTRRRTVDVVRRRSSSSATRSTVATGRRAGGLRRPPAAAAAATPRGGTVSSATPCCGLSACMDRRRRPG